MDFMQTVRASNITPEALASWVGVSYSTAKRWIEGESKPSALAQKEIQRIVEELKKA